MYAIYGSSSSPLMVQPPSLDEYLQFQAWREEKRQYQAYRQRCLQMERQRQRQRERLAAALEQQRHEDEQRRKQQRSLDQRQMMAYLEHIRQQQELKRQQEIKLQQQQKAREQEMVRQKLMDMQQLYWQTQQQQEEEEDDDDDDDVDLTDVMENLMAQLLHGNAIEGDHDMDTGNSDDESDTDEHLMALTDNIPNNEMTNDKQQQDTVSDSDSDSDDELVLVLTDDVTATTTDDAMVTNNSLDNSNDKQALKLATLKKIKEQLDDIHTSHQRILTSSLYFDNNNDIQQYDSDTIQVPTISKNHDFLQYEDNIMRILLQLDDISSEGDDLIRQERKDLVKQAGFILDQLDHHKQSEWERHSSTTASSVGSESEDNNDDDDDDNNYDTKIIADTPTDHFIVTNDLTMNHDTENDMVYELMQDVDDDGYLILNL